MKLKMIQLEFSLAVVAALAVSTLSSRAQNVTVTTSLTAVGAGGGVFDYTLTLNNTGTEAIQSFWLGWVPGSFNIASPSNPGNSLGWTSSLAQPLSVQYGGTAGTALGAGQSGTFSFDSTTTPAEFMAHTGLAGDSTAYGVNAANGQLSFFLSPPDTETFFLTVTNTPEPSTIALLAIGSLGFLASRRRKQPSVASGRTLQD